MSSKGGYIAPAVITADGVVRVNHVISIVDESIVSVSPFDGEVANTAYMDGVIIVADGALVAAQMELEGISLSSFNLGVIPLANELSKFIRDKYCTKTIYAQHLLYVNMEDGMVTKLL